MTRLVLCVAWMLASALPAQAQAQAQAPEVSLSAPRANGWWVGDVMTLHADITVPESFALVAASLPRPRAVTYWLTLRDLRVSQRRRGDARTFTLSFDYQIFYVALEPKVQTIPPLTLRFEGPDGRLVARVPEFAFVVSPLRPILAPTRLSELAPRRPISLAPARLWISGLGAGFILAFGASMGLLWHLGRGPWRRVERPFSRASRDIARALRRDAAALDAAYLSLHRAFDAALGRRMMARDIEVFVAAFPVFAPLRADIEPFFEASGAVFFSRGEGAWSAERLAALATRLAQLERRR